MKISLDFKGQSKNWEEQSSYSMETTIHYQQFIEILENYQRQSFEPMMDNSMDSITDLSCYSYERKFGRPNPNIMEIVFGFGGNTSKDCTSEVSTSSSESVTNAENENKRKSKIQKSTTSTGAATTATIGKSSTTSMTTMECHSCAVCGDSAAYAHYGVLTCEGCKGFFKRTVQKGRSDFVCLKTGTCEITPNNRSWCRLCRWKRCLIVGMVPNAVRSGHLAGRRGKLPKKKAYC